MRKLILTILLAVGVASVAQAREQISITGSSTVYPFSTVVAERFGETGFKTPVVESTGTGGGMKIFCKGVGVHTPDITNASRKIKDKEIKLCKENGVTEIDQVIVGLDGIAFVQNGKQKQVNFTRAQIWEAMSAKGSHPKKWSDIDSSLPNIEISIMVPPPTSGTRDAWNSLVMSKGCPKEIKEANKKDCNLLREDGAVIEVGENDTLIVQKLQSEDEKFGIFGYSYYLNNKDKTVAHKIEGKKISLEGIQDGSYPISRPLFFYVKKAHIGVIPGVDKFVESFTSKRAIGPRGYLTELGLIPLANPKEAITPVKMD
ncbi:putative phosphate ABC transporter [Pelagibacter phage Mosig EXVC030M]|nr:putative phosphate ABC transporter [Pelagibacter phage Mosig EXVC030M]